MTSLLLTLVLSIALRVPLIEARTAVAIDRIVPCNAIANCEAHHARVATTIAYVAARDEHPEDAAIKLVAACAHESRCLDVRQLGGGRARGPWQVEMPNPTDDLVMQAQWALKAARAGWSVYAGCAGGCRAAEELTRYELSARWAWSR